ncbi:interferon-induced very large GTPase 1-like [Archocentrus centrarchus]|uniref:interferon-induced very large GTPase 1-like n=1 Tax=Archocentrus centrarchus TaxID=63155 RepID=UPI0011E9F539|nr:interferon-induced very large GTPase 1-like [Archocentrus centrarchus]
MGYSDTLTFVEVRSYAAFKWCRKTRLAKLFFPHRQFIAFLEETDAEHHDLLYHSRVRWLSLGKVLQRVWDLKEEIGAFLELLGKADEFPELSNKNWLCDFAFAVDIFSHMNELNVNIQGKDRFVHDLYTSVKAFKAKLALFSKQILNESFTHFPTLATLKEEAGAKVKKYSETLDALHKEFCRRFVDFEKINKSLQLVACPLSQDPETAPEEMQLELIDLQADAVLKEKFNSLKLNDFYASLNEAVFPNLRRTAQKILALFGSTYVCEQTFSVMNFNKASHRSNLTDQHLRSILRIATTKLTPDFDALSDEGTDVNQSENSDDSTTLGGGSEIKSPEPSLSKHKGTSDEDMTVNKENISGNMEMTTKVSEEIKKKKPCHRETETLLGRLHLEDRLDQKFPPAGFLQIHPPVKQHHVTSEKDLAHTFLQRLMMLDYRARYIPVTPDSPEGTHPMPVRITDITVKDFSDLGALLRSRADTHQTQQTHVHPMDIQMAVFHCSDSFLKQRMITKLSHCQYALPLLVPDPVTMEIECPLWTFRPITKTWKVIQIKEDSSIVRVKSVPVCKAETPLVSFFRLGSLSVSKSQLMNTLINDRHSTFFHRNCPGSTKSRHLMDGVAEIAWYCPAGKPNDAFNDCIAFCNLHGDALLVETQREILIEKSSINIFLIASLQKQDKESCSLISAHFESQKPLICLCVDDSCDVVKTTTGKYIMGLKDRSQSDVSEELKKIIREVLSSLDGSHLKSSFQLETMAELSGIRVDETDPACQKGKSAAVKIMDLLTKDNMDVSKIKHEFLPCQGHLWDQWSKIHKELFHLRGDIEKQKSKKQQELMNIRQEQCAASCSKLMELFIESLSSLPLTEKVYFLTWIQIFMDTLSTDTLSSVLCNYDKKWSEVLALKNKHDKSGLLLRKQTELGEISKQLQSATFGLEHIFREMGQIYEAYRAIEGESRHSDWSKYPELAAQLMISGHPVELMDGDVGHVPLTWISSLLEEAIKKLGDQTVFVLSVLGLQSSGKSTMLNTMFGLQFAVSAGRCTKGAFMQLLKVSEEMKKDFKIDYVLVVDTEGLRALELEGNATRQHDNELATFVVGLGNLTLINIFGENPSEMQDILQIVVQAFMRMKEVKLSPSCVFVHQNVTDVAAAEKNMDGKRRLQEKLDQMAKLAAEEEVCNAECFSDVIEFDVQKDVKYCAQLWEGSPPMAPPNPGYSESIQDLKNTILSKASKSPGITLSQFKTKVQDLWNALLNENFVFSFKNTLEIAVYRKLEAQYGNWTWTLRSNMLAIENQLHNRIENGNLDKVEVIYLKKESNKTHETIRKAMTTYFEDDKENEMLVQWRGRFETKVKEFRNEQVSTVKRKLDEVIEQKKARKKLDDKKTEFEDKLLQKSKELAQQLKDKAKDEEELKKHFSSVWRGWVTELTADTKPVEDINLEKDQFTVLEELGFEVTLINECKQNGKYKNIPWFGDYSNYVKLQKILAILPSNNSRELAARLSEEIQNEQ